MEVTEQIEVLKRELKNLPTLNRADAEIALEVILTYMETLDQVADRAIEVMEDSNSRMAALNDKLEDALRPYKTEES